MCGMKKTDSEAEKRIVNLYLSGLSMEKTAIATKTTSIIVERVLRDNGVKSRSCAPIRPYAVNSNAFDDLSNEQSAYWLGFIYADGTTRRTCLSVGLAAKDITHLQKLSVFLGCGERAKITVRNSAWLQVSDRPLVTRLVELGIVPNRPNSTLALESIPPQSLHHFIRGAFDGDGCIFLQPQIMIVGRTPFLHALQDIFVRYAHANYVTIKSEHPSWGKLYYRGIYRCQEITDFLYKDATIFLERKYSRVKNWTPPQRHRQKRFWGDGI